LEPLITLKGLLQVIDSPKPVVVNLLDENDLLIIKFELPGYAALEDELEAAEVTLVKINNLYNLDIKINTNSNT